MNQAESSKQSRRFLIDVSGYSFANLGDTAMLQVAVLRIRQCFPDAAITVFTQAERDLLFYCPGVQAISPAARGAWLSAKLLPVPDRIMPPRMRTRIHSLYKVIKLRFPKTSNQLMRLTQFIAARDQRHDSEFFNIIRSVDAVLASGGGFITDAFQTQARNVLETLFIAQRLGKPTAMFGQGLGPLRNEPLMKTAQLVFRRLNTIGLREELEGLDLLNTMKVPLDRIYVTGDDAIVIALSNAESTSSRECIGVNIRQARYAGEIEAYLPEVGKTIDEIARSQGATVIPIPIHIGDSYRDLTSVTKICAIDDQEDAIARRITTPEALIQQISRCRVVVTGSYHAAVFALSQGIPVVALVGSDYYAVKFKGLAHQFELGCEIISIHSKASIQALRKAVESALQLQGRDQLIEKARLQVEASHAAWIHFLMDACIRE